MSYFIVIFVFPIGKLRPTSNTYRVKCLNILINCKDKNQASTVIILYIKTLYRYLSHRAQIETSIESKISTRFPICPIIYALKHQTLVS